MKNKKNKDSQKTLFSILAVLMIAALVVGGTYAWWTWNSANNTLINVTVKGGAMTIDGGGVITGKTLVPTDECNGSYAIVRTVTVTANNETQQSMTATVNLIQSGTLLDSDFKYYLSSTQSCSTTMPSTTFINDTGSGGTAGGSITGTSANKIATFTVPANSGEITKTYYLYIWLDSAETATSTQNKTVSITYSGTLTQ